MGTKSPYTLGPGEIYIDDHVFKACGSVEMGIPDVTADLDEIKDDVRTNVFTNEAVLRGYIKVPEFWAYKLTGLYNWIIDYCPNRRVVHLIKYGKTARVREKNFWRGLRILQKELSK